MTNVNENLFLQDSVKKELYISYDTGLITNEELHSNQFELTESVCSDSELRFGGCEASVLKFKISNIFEPLKNKSIDVSMVLNGQADSPFSFGKFKVYSDVPTADRNFRDVVAYDKMYEIVNSDVAKWYNSLEFPITMKDFRTSFVSFFGIEQVDIELVNDNVLIEKTVETAELSGGAVARAICEINGCFGRINREGVFDYVILSNIEKLYPSNELYPSNDLFPGGSFGTIDIPNSQYISCQYEDFVTKTIDAVEVRPEEASAGSIYGDAEGNVYTVFDNFLIYGKDSEQLNEIAKNILSVVKDIQYRPCVIASVGNPMINVGDYISVFTKYEIVNTYVLQRTIRGIQSLKDTYVAEGVEEYTNNVNSAKNDLIKIKSKVNILNREVDKTQSIIIDLEQNLRTEITQTADQIRLEVSETKDELREDINSKATSIIGDAEKIIMSALETYVTTGDLDNYRNTIETQFSILSDRIELEFSSITETMNESDNEIKEQINAYNKHITFSGENGIEIVDGTNTLSLILDSDGISFKKNGLEFGQWDGNNFYTGNIVVRVEERAQFGNFAFVPRSDGSLMFLKVGG